MPARQASPRDRCSPLTPQRQYVKTFAYCAVLAPQYMQGLQQFIAGSDVFTVVHQVNRGRSPVVFTDGMRGAGNGSAALIFGEGLRRERGHARMAFTHDTVQVTHRV